MTPCATSSTSPTKNRSQTTPRSSRCNSTGSLLLPLLACLAHVRSVCSTDGRVVFTGHTASPASAGGQLALSRAGDVVLATGTAMQAMNISSVLQPVAWTAQLQSTVQAFAIDTAANVSTTCSLSLATARV